MSLSNPSVVGEVLAMKPEDLKLAEIAGYTISASRYGEVIEAYVLMEFNNFFDNQRDAYAWVDSIQRSVTEAKNEKEE